MTTVQDYWDQLDCRFERVEHVFESCMTDALAVFSAQGINDYLENARFLGKMGRGAEPILIFLEEAPAITSELGEEAFPPIMDCIRKMWKSPNGNAIVPLLQTLAAATRRLQSLEQLQCYLDLIEDLMERTTGSIHGHHQTHPSPGLPEFLKQVPVLLSQLSLAGLKNWVEYGIHNYSSHPEHQKDYFSLQSADSRAILQRERHGTLLVDHERKLDLYLRALWRDEAQLVPFSRAFDELRIPVPYYDELGIRLPDVYDDDRGISGIDRYRATLAHMAAHRHWTTAIFADNFSPFQRLAVEFFEDSRVEYLAMQEYPGLRRSFLALHPQPVEGACDPDKESCLRHRLAMVSRAILDPEHPYQDELIIDFSQRFHTMMKKEQPDTQAMASLATLFVAKTRRQSDQLPNVYFTDTEIDYRDDNRSMWKFFEESDEEEMFEEHRPEKQDEDEPSGLPPRHYQEWDYRSKIYKPDWASVYEHIHPSGNPRLIDKLLAKHSALVKRLQRLIDFLKPQYKVRIRYQEDGTELDLDIAIRSLIDFKSGVTPDPRINMSHRTDGRSISVSLLLDLSQSLNEVPSGCKQTMLELSQEAVSLLGWAIEQTGDPFAIGGFHSSTRHEVRYYHIKGYEERWDAIVKARLAAMQAANATRMGAAIRHAGHYLAHRDSDKKLLLILSDGEPSDIDTLDERMLIEDARMAVKELDQQGIYTYCINVDPKADSYVADIFGSHYTIIDYIERLPERLPELFIALTK